MSWAADDMADAEQAPGRVDGMPRARQPPEWYYPERLATLPLEHREYVHSDESYDRALCMAKTSRQITRSDGSNPVELRRHLRQFKEVMRALKVPKFDWVRVWLLHTSGMLQQTLEQELDLDPSTARRDFDRVESEILGLFAPLEIEQEMEEKFLKMRWIPSQQTIMEFWVELRSLLPKAYPNLEHKWDDKMLDRILKSLSHDYQLIVDGNPNLASSAYDLVRWIQKCVEPAMQNARANRDVQQRPFEAARSSWRGRDQRQGHGLNRGRFIRGAQMQRGHSGPPQRLMLALPAPFEARRGNNVQQSPRGIFRGRPPTRPPFFGQATP